jgi:preprotein translocase subunit SecD
MWAPTRESFPILAISGHLAFTAATMLAVVASDAQSTRPAAVGLLAVSLPALAAWLYIESTGWVGPELASRIVHRTVIAVALGFSLAGFLTVIWSFSRLAVFAIVLEASVWYLAISGLSYLREEPDSRR